MSLTLLDTVDSLQRTAVVNSVDSCILNVGQIVQLLMVDRPFKSDMMEAEYSDATVKAFLLQSEEAAKHLKWASSTASTWLTNVGDHLARNLVEACEVNEEIARISLAMSETQQGMIATSERVNQLQRSIEEGHTRRNAATSELNDAEDQLRRRREERDIVRTVGFFTLFIPVVGIPLLAISMTALDGAVENQRSAVQSLERQCAADQEEFNRQQLSLVEERETWILLEASQRNLEEKQIQLSLECDTLEQSRDQLSVVSVKINDCLHALYTALGSANAMSTTASISHVVTCLKGILGALSTNRMLSGPLAQLNEEELEVLGKRIAAVRLAKGRLCL